MAGGVLIVDDDPDERYLVRMVLRDALPELEPLEIGDAVGFVEMFATETPRLAIVARELAWANALEIVRLLAERHPRCVTIMLGALAEDPTHIEVQPTAYVSRTPAGLARLGQVSKRSLTLRDSLASSEEQAQILDAVPVPIVHLSAEEVVLSANRAAAALFGEQRSANLVGRPFSDLVTIADPDGGLEAETSIVAAAARIPSGLGVVAGERADRAGARCRMVVRTRTNNGARAGFVVTLPRQPVVRGEGISKLLHAVLHDLRQPLGITRQSVQMLSDRLRAHAKLDTDADRMLQRIVSSTTRMDALMTGLLDYVRTGENPLRVEPVDLNEIVAEVVHELQPSMTERGANIHWQDLPVIEAGRDELRRLIENLLGNALKFSGRAPPLVEVACQDRGDCWVISVRDNGIGIDPSQTDRVFEPFQRLHTEAEYPGTGIGLSVCQQICVRHGGHMWVTPNPEGGSTFFATISRRAQMDKG